MKRCPDCRKDYLNDSLLYSLDDGAALVQGTVADEPATAILSGDAISGEAQTRILVNMAMLLVPRGDLFSESFRHSDELNL